MSETLFVKKILIYLEQRRDLICWRNNVGASQMNNRWVRFGVPGHADIFGILEGGKFFCVEAKFGKGRQSKEQKDFEHKVSSIGGEYILAYSLADIHARLPEYPHKLRMDF